MLIFPITLAYVTVVQRSDGCACGDPARVAVWVGEEWNTRASSDCNRDLTSTAYALLQESTRNRPQKLVVIGLGALTVFFVRHSAEKLRTWIDRRFFRETYNAEQVLQRTQRPGTQYGGNTVAH